MLINTYARRKIRSLCMLGLFAMVAAGQLAGCTAEPARALRVMSYNIHHGEGTDGVFDYARLAAVINAQHPDLVALQEVDRGTTRASGVDQAAELGRLTGMYHAYGGAMDYDGGEYGEAILSRWPIVTNANHILPKNEGSEPRALLVVGVAHPTFGDIIFAGTHLAHDSAADRLDQNHLIATILLGTPYEERTVILAGDFNARPESPPMRELLDEAGFADAFASDPRPTYPNVEPDRRIDFILFRGPEMLRVTEAIVITDEPASDHCAIVAELR